jgi:phosphate-selective porin OprO and OprP
VVQPKTRFVLLAVFAIVPVLAQSTDDKIEELQRKVEDLERRLAIAEGKQEAKAEGKQEVKAEEKQEVKAEGPAEKAPSAATASADTTGFKIQSNDGNFLLKIGADLQVDDRAFEGAGNGSLPDTILLRRVRPTFSGTIYKYVDFFFRPDFGQGQTIIYDAYLELKYFPDANLRVGKFKPPVGLERLQSDDDTSFVERGLPTLLVPSRDIGYQLSGSPFKGRIYYAAGVFNGVPDNGLSDSAASNHRDFAGRVFFNPFLGGGENPLSGLGFGIGASGGSVDKLALPSYKTVGQNNFVTFASGVTQAGHRTRLAPQALYYVGPFGLLAEYGLTEEGFQKAALRQDIAFRAWQVQVSYILTGERKGFTSPTPRRPFDPMNGGWGALELAARVGDFSAEQGLFNYGFADPKVSARRAHEWVGGLNWYLNRLLRISVDYGDTSFTGGAANGNRPEEKVILSRFQVNFI